MNGADSKPSDRDIELARRVLHRRANSATYEGDEQAIAHACAVSRAEEREACAHAIGEAAVQLIMSGDHNRARIVAGEAQRLRGKDPKEHGGDDDCG